MLKNDFVAFPKIKWLHLTGEVDKYVRFSCHIFSGFNNNNNNDRLTAFDPGQPG